MANSGFKSDDVRFADLIDLTNLKKFLLKSAE